MRFLQCAPPAAAKASLEAGGMQPWEAWLWQARQPGRRRTCSKLLALAEGGIGDHGVPVGVLAARKRLHLRCRQSRGRRRLRCLVATRQRRCWQPDSSARKSEFAIGLTQTWQGKLRCATSRERQECEHESLGLHDVAGSLARVKV